VGQLTARPVWGGAGWDARAASDSPAERRAFQRLADRLRRFRPSDDRPDRRFFIIQAAFEKSLDPPARTPERRRLLIADQAPDETPDFSVRVD
jgi:hypothetical protein